MKIIDVHNHVGFRFSGDLEDLIIFTKKAKDLGIFLVGITLNTTLKELNNDVLEFKTKKEKDPYFKWNVYLMDSIGLSESPVEIYPFLYLPPQINLAKDSMKKYEEKFGERKFGYKVHSQGIMESIQNLQGICSERPIIIHSSIDYSTPKDILNCFKEYKGNVLLAHFAKFDIETLKKIRDLPNFFIDSSVSLIMFKALKSKSSRIYHSEEFLEVKSPEELYLKASDICGEDKLVFATDYPFSENSGEGYGKEVEILLRIPERQRIKIAYENATKFLGL